MPTDLYTKSVLTIIAGALVVVAWQGTMRTCECTAERVR
jgi:hypothetical protein